MKNYSEIIKQATEAIASTKARSAWTLGVLEYALELIETISDALECGQIEPQDVGNRAIVSRTLLHGARDWSQYSHGGFSLICDGDIARRLCPRSEFDRSRGGERQPNKAETWHDVQARALSQAAEIVLREVLAAAKAD